MSDSYGQPDWDTTDYQRDFTYLGIDRGYTGSREDIAFGTYSSSLDCAVRYQRPRTTDEVIADARAAGVIVCDCLWIEGRLTIWVPWCQAHGGGCSACNHRHVNLSGIDV